MPTHFCSCNQKILLVGAVECCFEIRRWLWLSCGQIWVAASNEPVEGGGSSVVVNPCYFQVFVTDSSTTQHGFSLTSCSLLCQRNIGTRWQWCCSLTWYVREEGEIFQGMSEIGDSDIVRSCCANLSPLRNCIKNSLGTPCFMNARQFLINLCPSFGRRELAFNAVSH